MKPWSIKRRASAAGRMAAPRRRRRGSAIMEFALISPTLLMLTVLCLDFGRIPFYYIGVTNAARAGAGYAAANPYPYDATAQATWLTNAQSAVTAELASNSWYTANTTYLTYNVTVPTTNQLKTGGYWPATVTVNYTFHPFIKWTFFGWYNSSNPNRTITLTRTVVMQGQI